MAVPSDSQSLRLFWAIVPPLAVRRAAARALAQVPAARHPDGLRAVSEESLHFTLHFLGSVAADRLPVLQAAGRAVAELFASFELSLSGAGAFPEPSHARILWLGVKDGGAELSALAQHIGDADAALGFPREERAFAAHLTLARLRAAHDLRHLLAALVLPELRFTAQELVLVRSHLGHEGSRYEALLRLPLRVA